MIHETIKLKVLFKTKTISYYHLEHHKNQLIIEI